MFKTLTMSQVWDWYFYFEIEPEGSLFWQENVGKLLLANTSGKDKNGNELSPETFMPLLKKYKENNSMYKEPEKADFNEVEEVDNLDGEEITPDAIIRGVFGKSKEELAILNNNQ